MQVVLRSPQQLNIMIVESHAGSTEITTAVVDGYAKDERCKKIMKDPQRYGYRVRWNMLERIEDGSILVPDIRDIKTHILRSIRDVTTRSTTADLGLHSGSVIWQITVV